MKKKEIKNKAIDSKLLSWEKILDIWNVTQTDINDEKKFTVYLMDEFDLSGLEQIEVIKEIRKLDPSIFINYEDTDEDENQ